MTFHLVQCFEQVVPTGRELVHAGGVQGGKLPIVCDTSPCLSTLKAGMQTKDLKCASTLAAAPRPPFPLLLLPLPSALLACLSHSQTDVWCDYLW